MIKIIVKVNVTIINSIKLSLIIDSSSFKKYLVINICKKYLKYCVLIVENVLYLLSGHKIFFKPHFEHSAFFNYISIVGIKWGAGVKKISIINMYLYLADISFNLLSFLSFHTSFLYLSQCSKQVPASPTLLFSLVWQHKNVFFKHILLLRKHRNHLVVAFAEKIFPLKV